MSTKTKKLLIISGVSIAVLTLLILGTIFDLQISKAVADLQPGQYHSKNLFAIIGETIGENILYVLLVSALCILFFYLKHNPLNKKWLNTLIQIGLCVVSFVVCFYCLHKTLEYVATHTLFGLDKFIESTLGLIVIILASIIVTILAFLLFTKVSNENLKNLWKWALLVLILAAASNLIVQTAKHIFDRTRFRAMVFVGDTDFQYYDHWFKFNQNKFDSISVYAEDFFKSFPSGHTCAAASSFFLILLPLFLPQTNNKKWKSILWSSASVYTFLVALSRIVAGAHYFMDVFVGGGVCIILTLIALFSVKAIQSKEKSLNSQKEKSTLEEVKENIAKRKSTNK